MMRCQGIESDGRRRSDFRILEEDAPATPEVWIGFKRADIFHNGIVFAAFDAVNDPLKNPTLTLRATEETG